MKREDARRRQVVADEEPASDGEATLRRLAAEGKDVCELVMVPKVRARLSAGNGSLETSAEVVGRFAFRSEWIRSKGQVSKMVLMEVTGDSMQPALLNGDTVLIDQGAVDIIAGAIYAVGMDNEVIVKCVDKIPGKYVLRSLNAVYPPIEIDFKDESLNVRIIGRVLWWCREAG